MKKEQPNIKPLKGYLFENKFYKYRPSCKFEKMFREAVKCEIYLYPTDEQVNPKKS